MILNNPIMGRWGAGVCVTLGRGWQPGPQREEEEMTWNNKVTGPPGKASRSLHFGSTSPRQQYVNPPPPCCIPPRLAHMALTLRGWKTIQLAPVAKKLFYNE